MPKAKKIILMLLLYIPVQLFSETDFQEIYQKLQGAWTTPSESAFSAQFNFNSDGTFTTSINPFIDYKTLSPELQASAAYDENYEGTGYFKIIKTIPSKDKQNQDLLKVIIYLNEELSTNTIDVTKDTIYIYSKDENGKTSRDIFMERIEN